MAEISPAQSLKEKIGVVKHVPVEDPDAEFGGIEERRRLERKLLWKLDCRMFIVVIMHILDHTDKNSATAARLRGFEEDLNLKGQEFNTLLSILYIGYILMQVPSNMFLNYVGKPSIYLPVCMIIWGVIPILTGITKDFTGALLTRFFLGFVESTFYPGALFLLSKWYTRKELGLRICLLYCGNIISNAFGTLMASGILDGMQGKLGQAAWRWLFFIEGGLTVAFALFAIIILPDFPTTTRWLSPQERSLALKRMEEDGGINIGDQDEPETSSATSSLIDGESGKGSENIINVSKSEETFFKRFCLGLRLAISDWKVWWLSVTLTSEVMALSFNAFFPTLTATLGFNRTVTLVLAAPPWFAAAFVSFFNARHSDKSEERFYHIVGPLAVGIVGFIIAISTMNLAARYISLFLMSLSYAGLIVLFAWISNTIARPASKRAVALALSNCVSQLGNIAGSYIWPTKWGPSYRNSYAICISLQALAIIMCWIFRCHLKSLNDELEKEEREKGVEEKGFRYLL